VSHTTAELPIPMNSDRDPSACYMQQVIAWQPRLYSFILSLTGNPNEAEDVLQNANLVLLQERESFRCEADFYTWARKIAYHQVLHHRTSCARAKQRFDDVVLDQLATRLSTLDAEPAAELHALHDCTAKLPPEERHLLDRRYAGSSVRTLADDLGRSIGSISQTLYRIRAKLAECVKRALNAEHRK
jgi:RNA polymerase sigma-70 factor, ECF subfamily